MKKRIALIFLIFNFGCAASNTISQGACHFDLSQITNGPNLELMDSQWEYLGDKENLETFSCFALFEDNEGTVLLTNSEGLISYEGFSWDKMQCQDVLISTWAWSGFSKRRLKNIQGSREEGFLCFDFITRDSEDFVVCNLLEF